jgi:hypothetical protein
MDELEVSNYINYIQKLMKLDDWHFILKLLSNYEFLSYDLGEGVYAKTTIDMPRKYAYITLNTDITYHVDEDWKLTIRHEMAHITTHELDRYLQSTYSDLQTNEFYNDLVERLVEDIARCIA